MNSKESAMAILRQVENIDIGEYFPDVKDENESESDSNETEEVEEPVRPSKRKKQKKTDNDEPKVIFRSSSEIADKLTTLSFFYSIKLGKTVSKTDVIKMAIDKLYKTVPANFKDVINGVNKD